MSLEHSDFWFLLIFGVGMFFVSLVILFGLQIAWSEDVYVEDYKDCIKQDLPPRICDMIFPPLKQQNV